MTSAPLTVEQFETILDAKLDEKLDAKLDVLMSRIFEVMNAGFERMDAKFMGITGLLKEGLDNLSVQVQYIQRRVGNLEVSMVDVQESLHILTSAEEKDAKASMNHEKRIRVLEKRSGIRSVPPGHLAGI